MGGEGKSFAGAPAVVAVAAARDLVTRTLGPLNLAGDSFFTLALALGGALLAAFLPLALLDCFLQEMRMKTVVEHCSSRLQGNHEIQHCQTCHRLVISTFNR